MRAALPHDPGRRLLRAGLVTGVIDGLFASLLNILAYGSTATRLWQGVASVLLGPAALQGGTATAAIGVLMHFGVAFAWSAVFLLLLRGVPFIRRVTETVAGAVVVACVYGPLIWILMSFVVIPLFTGRRPTITLRWWVQLLGHIPFVAMPIVMATRDAGVRLSRAPASAR